MNLKKNIIYKIIITIINFCIIYGQGTYVKYGWELFEYVVDARTASLGSAAIAYNINTIQSTIINPSLINKRIKNISITHQSRYGGMVNSDLLGIQLGKNDQLINLNFIYQGITNLPDTRDMLIDWGLDGIFGTNDYGEGNGIIDEGERLDASKLRFFSQYQFGFHSAFFIRFFDLPIGIGIKTISYIIDDNSALGMGLDIGYNKTFNKSSFGFVIKNFPSSGLIWNTGTIEGTTPSFSLGIHHPMKPFKQHSIIIHAVGSIEGSFSNANLESDFKSGIFSLDGSFGFEGSYNDKIMIRFGKNTVNNLTGGIGLQWEVMGLDYCFLSTSNNIDIKNHHLISLKLSIDWIISKFLKK